MALGRLLHYGVDAVLLSTLMAGIRRSSGFTPHTESITEPTVRSVAEQYLGIGETIFDVVQATAVNSKYFKRDERQ